MSILKQLPTSVTPPTPSKDVVVKNIVSRIEDKAKETFNMLVRTQHEGIKILWENPDATPQEIIDGLGTNAGRVFQFHGALTDFIKSLAAMENLDQTIKYPTNSFSVGLSGQITINDDPYIIP